MIKKVLIIVPPLVNINAAGARPDGQPNFEAYRLVSPVEPVTVAADLQNRGFEVTVFDTGLYLENRYTCFEEKLCEFRPDAVVAIQSILTFATAQDWDGKQMFEISRRQLPQVVTVLTGTHATNYPGKAVQEKICDYSICGEVDFAVGDLFLALNGDENFSVIAGLAYRVTDDTVKIADSYPTVDVTNLPLPAYSLFNQEEKNLYTKVLEFGKIRYPEKSNHYRDIMTSRGCISRCAFCSVAHLRGKEQGRRKKPLDLLMREIEDALADGIKEIHFFDDLFAANKAEIMEFTNELVRRNYHFDWMVAQGMPLWPLDYDVLSAMKEAGMYRIICPFESGNNRVLKEVMAKPLLKVEHNHDVIMWASQLGLEIIGMFVVGMVGEKRQEVLDTILFAEEHPQIDYSIFSIATPMIGTRLMDDVVSSGQFDDAGKLNKVIKRTVALYRTEEFSELELGVIRTFDWDRINFSTLERQKKYAAMVGISLEELAAMRNYSQKTFYRFFPNYHGSLSFKDLYAHPHGNDVKPVIR